jgi:hypothetical protein
MEAHPLSKPDAKTCHGPAEAAGVVPASDYEEDDESLDHGKVGRNEEVCLSQSLLGREAILSNQILLTRAEVLLGL